MTPFWFYFIPLSIARASLLNPFSQWHISRISAPDVTATYIVTRSDAQKPAHNFSPFTLKIQNKPILKDSSFFSNCINNN